MGSLLKYRKLFYICLLLLFYLFILNRDNKQNIISLNEKDLNYKVKFNELLQKYSILKYRLEKKGMVFSHTNDYQYLVSRIIKRDVLDWQSGFKVALMDDHKVKIHTPVLESGYFIGLISSVEGNEAEVITIFSRKQPLICDVGNYFAVGVLEGGISNELCFLNYLPKDYKFKVGDKVYVSAQSNLAKRRFLVGEIVELKNYPLKKTAKVKITWDLRKINYVNLLVD